MPVGKARVGDIVEPFRRQWIGDVENDAIARTRARGEIERGEDGDVVALVGHACFLRAFAMVAAAPQAGDPPVLREDARAVDDPRGGRIGQQDLDHIDAEQRGVVAAALKQPGSSRSSRT